MSEVGRPPAASAIRIEPMDPSCFAAQFCLQSYFTELAGRFDAGFDPAVSISATNGELTPPAGVLLIATLAADPIGCGALKFDSRAYAEIKRMWVSPTARGLGVGRRLLIELENLAAARGVRTVRLETNRALTEAIRLYRSSGYEEVPPFNEEPYAHHWFEKVLASTS